jgi:uncharacterized membrane protein (UPF0182 family)
VQKVAPFLKVDGDPYPIVDPDTGHIVWIVDAYTTMANYPYSERQSLSDLTSDSLTRNKKTAGQPNSQINYIRNSVKATVDAYDGTVKLYQWDDNDPVLKAWTKAFPGLVEKKSAMPAGISEHVRYPEDLFEVQRSLLEKYHVDDPVTFYNVGDKWTVPSDPAPGATGDQPPYYVLADAPNGATTASQFQLTSPMKVNNKSNLAAFITVDSDPGTNYGKMTVLRVPTGSVIQGPEQVANNLFSTDVIARELTLFDQRGSQVVYGNLLTLPIGGTFLYVEPLYVQGASNGFPLLRRVAVSYGDRIGYGATLAAALGDLAVGHQPGESIGQPGGGGTTTTPPSSTNPPPSGSSAPPGPVTQQAALADLNTAFSQLEAAFKSGDFAVIGAAQAKVQKLLSAYLAKYPTSASGSGTPSSTPSKTK